MGFYYTPKTIMRDINCAMNGELCRILLKHDPRMISQMYNYDFEMVKPIIDMSVTFLGRADLREAIDEEELSKIMVHAYRKSKTFRKDALEGFFGIMSQASREAQHFTQLSDGTAFNSKAFEKIIKILVEENPIYSIIIENDYYKEMVEFAGLDYKTFVKSINFKKLYKIIAKKIENCDEANSYNDRAIAAITKTDVNNAYWRVSNFTISEENIDYNIKRMTKDFPEIPEIPAIYLLIKMK
jgi:hypothetical protein